MMKKSRQDKILELVATHNIDTQDELIDRLRESGYDVTQATVSRDIRALNLIKVQTEMGRYRYVRSQRDTRNQSGEEQDRRSADHHAQSIVQVAYAINNVVVKTTPGMASAVALYLDRTYHQMMLGSVAGDDTVIIVTRNDEDSRKLCEQIVRKMDI
ncbi:MAG: arginine repressor [Clostridia bacterium]|nr:arginine repressor [Clostridia bacterium]